MAEMWYCLHKRSANPQDMTRVDAMSCIVSGDLAGLERLAWAIFDGALATGDSPELGPNESWKWVVRGIFNKLVYIGRNPSDRCPMITMGAKDMQEPGIQVEVPATCSHHQGLEPTQSANKRCLAPSVKSMVLAVPPEPVGYQRRWATEAYSEWDKGEEDQVEFDYRRRSTFALDGAGPPLAMHASPNKSMKPNLRNVKLWFTDMERQLQEEADYPWWPQASPLLVGWAQLLRSLPDDSHGDS